jgi:hypothetical protein
MEQPDCDRRFELEKELEIETSTDCRMISYLDILAVRFLRWGRNLVRESMSAASSLKTIAFTCMTNNSSNSKVLSVSVDDFNVLGIA